MPIDRQTDRSTDRQTDRRIDISFLFQRVSLAIERFKSVLLRSSFDEDDPGQHFLYLQQACAAAIAVLYAALACKQNTRYHTSARLTKTRDRCSNVNKHGTDRQTDR